jgi:hypothetical protein
MEPVFMILGQSAATAACLSIDKGIALQDLPYEALKERLLADKQVLELDDPHALSSRRLPGIVIDDTLAKFTGDWPSSSTTRPFVDSGYRHDGNLEKGQRTARFETMLKAGTFEVRLFYPAQANRASNIPVTIHALAGPKVVTVNQRQKPPIDGQSVSLGIFEFNGPAVVEISNSGTDGHVIADAVQFLPVK